MAPPLPVPPIVETKLVSGISIQKQPSFTEYIQFDSQFCSSNIVLETQTRARKIGTSNHNAAVLGTKANSFQVKLISNCGGLKIGFAPKSINLNHSNYDSCGYYMLTFDGTLYSQRGEYFVYLESSVQDGSVVGCELKYGRISYTVNGKNYGFAFVNIPTEPELFPAFEALDQDCVFELVKPSSLNN